MERMSENMLRAIEKEVNMPPNVLKYHAGINRVNFPLQKGSNMKAMETLLDKICRILAANSLPVSDFVIEDYDVMYIASIQLVAGEK